MASTTARIFDRLLGKNVLKDSIIRGQILHYRAVTHTLRVFTHGRYTQKNQRKEVQYHEDYKERN